MSPFSFFRLHWAAVHCGYPSWEPSHLQGRQLCPARESSSRKWWLGRCEREERVRLFVSSGGAAPWCVGHIKIFDRLQDYENGSMAPGCSAALSEHWELRSGPFGPTQCVLIPCNEIKGFWAVLHLASLTVPFFPGMRIVKKRKISLPYL